VKAGLVGSVLAGTTFFLRLQAGALVDRWNRKAILLVCDAGRALSAGALAVMLALGHFFFLQVLVVAFLDGAFGVLFGPAESAAVKRVVARAQVRDAVARNQSRMQLAGLVGPPIGGVLLDAGRALPFVADAASYLVSLGGVLCVRSSLQVLRGRRRSGGSAPSCWTAWAGSGGGRSYAAS
jgi:MFS family permease